MKFAKLKVCLLPALLAAALSPLSAPAAASWFGSRAEARAKRPAAPAPALRPRVEVAVVKRLSSVQQGINTTSTLQALEEVILSPKVTGRIDSIAVAKGDPVEAGDTLVVLDSRSQEAEYSSMQAQVAVSKAELAQSAVTLADAKRELDRYTRLRKSGYATQQEYDTRSTTYQAAVAANAKAAAQVKQALANLEAQSALLGEYRLKAPIKGVVLDDYDLTPGALVKDAASVLRIGRVDRLKARVDIPERDMGRLRPGMDAVLAFESLGGQTFYGAVTLIDPYINTSTRTIGAEITVDNQATGFKLRPGMFARVLLVETSEENPLVIPSEALRADGSVMVVRGGRAAIQKIAVGAATGGMVTVSEGLQIGEDVVVSGGNNVKEGDEVEFVITGE